MFNFILRLVLISYKKLKTEQVDDRMQNSIYILFFVIYLGESIVGHQLMKGRAKHLS